MVGALFCRNETLPVTRMSNTGELSRLPMAAERFFRTHIDRSLGFLRHTTPWTRSRLQPEWRLVLDYQISL